MLRALRCCDLRVRDLGVRDLGMLWPRGGVATAAAIGLRCRSEGGARAAGRGREALPRRQRALRASPAPPLCPPLSPREPLHRPLPGPSEVGPFTSVLRPWMTSAVPVTALWAQRSLFCRFVPKPGWGTPTGGAGPRPDRPPSAAPAGGTASCPARPVHVPVPASARASARKHLFTGGQTLRPPFGGTGRAGSPELGSCGPAPRLPPPPPPAPQAGPHAAGITGRGASFPGDGHLPPLPACWAGTGPASGRGSPH